MDELSWLDTDIIPKHGDFSFISNKFIREFLSFDFKLNLKFLDLKIETRNICWPNHTDKSFKCSIFLLRNIRTYGWTEFVINSLNLFL